MPNQVRHDGGSAESQTQRQLGSHIIVPLEGIRENASTGNDLPGMMQIPRELYQNLQLFAKWRAYDNPAFCGNFLASDF